MQGRDETESGSPRSAPIEVTLVTAKGCHFCHDAAELLDELRHVYRLTVREVELSTDQGAAIATRFRVPFPPIVLIDGIYAEHGRISARKLTRTLDETSRAGASR